VGVIVGDQAPACSPTQARRATGSSSTKRGGTEQGVEVVGSVAIDRSRADPPPCSGEPPSSQGSAPRGVAARWLGECARLLDGPVDELLEAMTSRSERGCELRQNSPFAGVLTQRERGRILANLQDLAT